MCKCADVQICKFLRAILPKNLHICTSANLHIKSYFFVILIIKFTKEKGGIHAIYRLFMETFGWYRLTGFLHQNILPAKMPETTVYGQWFFCVPYPLFQSLKLWKSG
jgi:hypothetical protein